MNIAIIGYGKMGHMIENVAKQRHHNIAIRIDTNNKEANEKDISNSIRNADVCIDFTQPDAVVDNIKKATYYKKNIVVGTTGWYERLDDVRKIVLESNIGLIYSSNFSLGMNLFLQIVELSAKLFNNHDMYDVAGFELHHNQKADSPSGTAKTLAQALLRNIKRKNSIVYALNDKIKPNELHFSSLRVGSVPGTHAIIFDSSADTIELSHTARSREGFALGAVIAAEWVYGKRGLFTMADLFKG